MNKTKGKIPPVVTLDYSKGDLIIKAGDYGISIYEVISGKVGIFIESGGTETRVAVLGPGMIVGEMAFIAGNTSTRSASARALEDCCLEAWHPAMFLDAYKQMPDILRLISGQALKLIVRMNKMVVELSVKQEKLKDGQTHGVYDPQEDKRKFYRKIVSLECVFRPVNSPEDLKLSGRIRDISKGGLGMTVKTSGLLNYTPVSGDELFIKTYFLPDQKVNMTAKIIWLKKGKTDGTISLGTVFTHMDPDDRKRLGFFLMP
ncbi:MAG: cyclic nucleotide-binding domain-containing protein [Desulfobacterales bacterium]